MADRRLVHGAHHWGALLPVTLFPVHRLEKEMESLEVAMAVEVQQLVNQKLPETTRLTMEENTQVKARFNQLSEEVVVLMGENTALRANKSQLSVNVSTLEKMMSEVSRQNALRKKVGSKRKISSWLLPTLGRYRFTTSTRIFLTFRVCVSICFCEVGTTTRKFILQKLHNKMDSDRMFL